MKIGDRVKFTWPDPSGNFFHEGAGTVVEGAWSKDANPLHWFVAQDPAVPGGPHVVLYCAETWLTVVQGAP